MFGMDGYCVVCVGIMLRRCYKFINLFWYFLASHVNTSRGAAKELARIFRYFAYCFEIKIKKKKPDHPKTAGIGKQKELEKYEKWCLESGWNGWQIQHTSFWKELFLNRMCYWRRFSFMKLSKEIKWRQQWKWGAYWKMSMDKLHNSLLDPLT